MAKRGRPVDGNGFVRPTNAKKPRIAKRNEDAPPPLPLDSLCKFNFPQYVGVYPELREMLYQRMDLATLGKLAQTCRVVYLELCDMHSSRYGCAGCIWVPSSWRREKSRHDANYRRHDYGAYHNGVRAIFERFLAHKFFKRIPLVGSVTRIDLPFLSHLCQVIAVQSVAGRQPNLVFEWQVAAAPAMVDLTGEAIQTRRLTSIVMTKEPTAEQIEAFIQPLIAAGKARRAKARVWKKATPEEIELRGQITAVNKEKVVQLRLYSEQLRLYSEQLNKHMLVAKKARGYKRKPVTQKLKASRQSTEQHQPTEQTLAKVYELDERAMQLEKQLLVVKNKRKTGEKHVQAVDVAAAGEPIDVLGGGGDDDDDEEEAAEEEEEEEAEEAPLPDELDLDVNPFLDMLA